MFAGPGPCKAFPCLSALLLLTATSTGCVSVPDAPREPDVQALRLALISLGPAVSGTEADRVARCAYQHSRELAREYRVVRPPFLHNSLINLGLKERGLCYQWAEDLLNRLRKLATESLELRWGKARAGTWREHNSVVVTAVGAPFETGIVLDPWRRSGRLVWQPVRTDKYPWQEVDPPWPPPAIESARE